MKVNLKLYGGLGNQIFQLGAALLLLRSSSSDSILVIDDKKIENYDVPRENVLKEVFSDLTYKSESITLLNLRLPRFIVLKMKCNPFVGDINFQYHLKGLRLNSYYLDGYFQSSLTQLDFINQINILKPLLRYQNYSYRKGAVIHIRGGDFIKLGWNSVSGLDYYKRSISYLYDKHSVTNFKVVTDDREYAEQLMLDLGVEYEFVGNTIYDDFKLIGSYRYRILSSSTFSFWASALGLNDDSVVIAPEYWSPGKRRNILLPNEVVVRNSEES